MITVHMYSCRYVDDIVCIFIYLLYILKRERESPEGVKG